MDFTPIETQEQFDAMVKDRVERAKKSAAKEYETQLKDLAQTKETLTAKDTEIGTLKAKISDLEREKETNGGSFKSMQKELENVKLGALRQKIAIEEGLPLEMAARLNGDDEEALREDAKAVKGLMGAKHVAPMFNNEEKNEGNEGYREMAKFFRKE